MSWNLLTIKFNRDQTKELSKALFNTGNISFGSLILKIVASGHFDLSVFTIGTICFIAFFTLAIMLLSK